MKKLHKLTLVILLLLSQTLVFSQDLDSLFKVGFNLQKQDKFSEAIILYQSILNQWTGDPNAMYQKALCHMRLQQSSEALPLFLTLAKNRPDFIGGIYGAATAYVALGKFQEGLEYIDKAIGIEPNNAEYFMIRGRIFIGLGNKKMACADFKKAKKLGSFDAQFSINNYCK
jgi:tetratricopeptide (TPR) repeat protein